MATLHLMHGFIGAGKTTYAKKLEKELKALRLNSDEWMLALYGNNPPASSFTACEEKVRALQWEVAMRVLAQGGDVILDWGFWKLATRNEIRHKLAAQGVSYRFYAMQTDKEVMRERCRKRTEEGGNKELFIDNNAFDEFWPRFEPMSEEEVCERIKSA